MLGIGDQQLGWALKLKILDFGEKSLQGILLEHQPWNTN
jgi:hypothetical protein